MPRVLTLPRHAPHPRSCRAEASDVGGSQHFSTAAARRQRPPCPSRPGVALPPSGAGLPGEPLEVSRSSAVRESWGAPTKLIVGYIGRLANEKRVHDLAILDRDPRIQLVIVGDGPAREKLESELPNARFTGFKSGAELAQAYASFDLFIHPGPNETFCQSVQEALASGTPCIVPTTGGPADLISNGSTGYIINTSDPIALVGAVEHFMARTDHGDMRTMARDSVSERTWAKINGQLLGHYESLISSPHSHRKSAA